ncbi:MAG: MGMT family protein [Candidatus Dormiibacterota bacterium]
MNSRPGDILTYGQLAQLAGHPGAARAVGRVLASSSGLPWWRVVSSGGRLVPGLEEEQASRLALEANGTATSVELSGRACRDGGPRPASPSPTTAPGRRARSRRPPR